jgi:hypothetical protein
LNLQHLVPSVIEAIETESGKPVGNSRPPGTPAELEGIPYAVVYQLLTDFLEPTSFADPHDMVWVAIQVTSVAESAQQANWMADQVRRAIIGRAGQDWIHAITPSGLEICGRTLAITVGVEEEDGVFNATERYRLLVTGA